VGELVIGEAAAEGVDAAQAAGAQRRPQQLAELGDPAVGIDQLVGLLAAVEDVDLTPPAGDASEEAAAARPARRA
jgi:hypothetical protein